MKFEVGIYGSLNEEYDYALKRIIEREHVECHHWCDKFGIEYHKKQGKILLCTHVFEIEVGINREAIVNGMVESLREHKKSIRAEMTRQVTDIDARINRLLALDYCDVSNSIESALNPAPKWPKDDVTDVGDIPF